MKKSGRGEGGVLMSLSARLLSLVAMVLSFDSLRLSMAALEKMG